MISVPFNSFSQMSTEQTDWTEHHKPSWTHKFWPEMTALHAAVKSGQILLWTSQKKEENDCKGSKGQVFELPFVDFDPFYFCLFVLSLWLWWQGFELMHMKLNGAIFPKFTFCKITALQEKTLAGVKVAFRQRAYK